MADGDLFSRAKALELNGDLIAAISMYQDYLNTSPQDERALREMGRTGLVARRPEIALECAKALYAIRAAHPAGLALEARARARLSDGPAAGRAAARLQAAAREHAEAAYGLAQLALDRRDIGATMKSLDDALMLNPFHGAASAMRGSLLTRMRRFEAAERDLSRAIGIDARDDVGRIGRAELLVVLGRFAEAEADFRALLKIAPDFPAAIAGLLDLSTQDEATLRSRAVRALQKNRMLDTERTPLELAIARSFARDGFATSALEHAGAANGRRAATNPFAPSVVDARLVLDDVFGEIEPPQTADDGPKPILVCGLPRSGTTLVERILSQHSMVAAGGELHFLRKAAAWCASQPDPVAALRARRSDLAAAYRAQLRSASDGEPFVVDKMPDNWAHLGLARALLGHVDIVRVKRDARDTAISIYLEFFADEEAYTHTFEGVADVAERERRRFDRADATVKSGVREVVYEFLVTEPGQAIADLLASLGLPFEDGCLHPERSSVAAATASRVQARRPIYRTSVDRWRSFADLMPRIIDRLAEIDGLDDASVSAFERLSA